MNPEEPTYASHLNEIRSSFTEVGLSTVIICGKIRAETDTPAVLQVHRKAVEDEVNSEHANVTGIIMCQSNSFLHFLEGPSYSLLRILSVLSRHEHFENSIQQGRVVYVVEDRPKRYFPEWYSCTIPERRSPNEDLTPDNCKSIVHDVASGLLEVGKGLQIETSEDIEFVKYAEHLPGKNTIILLSNSPLFFTIEEFVSIYSEPFMVELESESTFPLDTIASY